MKRLAINVETVWQDMLSAVGHRKLVYFPVHVSNCNRGNYATCKRVFRLYPALRWCALLLFFHRGNSRGVGSTSCFKCLPRAFQNSVPHFFFGCGKHGIQGDYHDHGLYPCFTFTKKTLLISFMNGSIALEQKLVLQNEHHSIFHPCLRQAVKSADSDPAGTNIFSQDSSFQRRKEAPDLEWLRYGKHKKYAVRCAQERLFICGCFGFPSWNVRR